MVEIIFNEKVILNPKIIQKQVKRVLFVLSKKRIRNKKFLKKNLVIVFVGQSEMKKLNLQFRGHNKVTDILSFDGEVDQREKKVTLGELVLCAPQIQKQAKEHKLLFEEELFYMLLHGVLHLLGYDHEKSKREARLMFRIQDQIFAQRAKYFKFHVD